MSALWVVFREHTRGKNTIGAGDICPFFLKSGIFHRSLLFRIAHQRQSSLTRDNFIAIMGSWVCTNFYFAPSGRERRCERGKIFLSCQKKINGYLVLHQISCSRIACHVKIRYRHFVERSLQRSNSLVKGGQLLLMVQLQ
jgi:hypothetical protein